MVRLAAAAAAAPTTRPLAEIASLDELAKQPLIALPTGEKVRIGTAPYDAEQGPWRLVYCRIESKGVPQEIGPDRAGVAARRGWPEVDLGPLTVTLWRRDDHEKVVDDLKRLTDARQYVLPVTLVQVVALSQSGDITLGISTQDHEPVAETSFTVDRGTTSPWRAFAVLDFEKAEQTPGEPDALVSNDSTPVVPDGEATAALSVAAQAQPTTRPAVLQIPQLLELSLEGRVFVVKTRQGKMVDMPDETLLARWWMNGKALPAGPVAKEGIKKADARKISDVTEQRIAFGLPKELKSAKPGDRISLQVLYSASGYEPFAIDQLHAMDAKAVFDSAEQLNLAMSNRIEFEITAELLRHAAK